MLRTQQALRKMARGTLSGQSPSATPANQRKPIAQRAAPCQACDPANVIALYSSLTGAHSVSTYTASFTSRAVKNDLLIAMVNVVGTNVTLLADAGWTHDTTIGTNPTVGVRRVHVYWRIADGSETAATFSTSDSSTGDFGALVFAVRGPCVVSGDQMNGRVWFSDGQTAPGNTFISLYSAQTFNTGLDIAALWADVSSITVDDYPIAGRPNGGFTFVAASQAGTSTDRVFLYARLASPRVDTIFTSSDRMYGAYFLDPHCKGH